MALGWYIFARAGATFLWEHLKQLLQHDDVSLEMPWCVDNHLSSTQNMNKIMTFAARRGIHIPLLFREAPVFWSTKGWNLEFLPWLLACKCQAELQVLDSLQKPMPCSLAFPLSLMHPYHPNSTSGCLSWHTGTWVCQHSRKDELEWTWTWARNKSRGKREGHKSEGAKLVARMKSTKSKLQREAPMAKQLQWEGR